MSFSLPKVWRITLICLVIWTSLLVVLSIIWYKTIFKGHFTFFDDAGEWLQMDKAGHFFASFQVSRWFIQILKWQGVEEKEAKKIGVWGGLIFVSPIELLDGFSEAYGFSWTDLAANLSGSLALLAQLHLFAKIKFMPKFSFMPSPFAAIRKEMLGTFFLSQLIKDYNAQTYWLSFSPNVFLKRELFPPWLQISVGYGAENLLGGHDNIWEKEGEVFDFSHLARTRQFYLSLDLSFQHLQENTLLKRALKLVTSCLKFPFPSLCFDLYNGLSFKWI